MVKWTHIYAKGKMKLLRDNCKIYESVTIRLNEDWGVDLEYVVETEEGEFH